MGLASIPYLSAWQFGGIIDGTERSTAFLIVQDAVTRNYLARLLGTFLIPVEAFPSREHFLQKVKPDRLGCVLHELEDPGHLGLDLLEGLRDFGFYQPMIVLSSIHDISLVVKLIKGGVYDYLTKPFDPELIFESLRNAMVYDRQIRASELDRACTRKKLESLTSREMQVLWLVIDGDSTKEIAQSLGISWRTVEKFRASILKKLEVDCLAQLVHLVSHCDEQLLRGEVVSGQLADAG